MGPQRVNGMTQWRTHNRYQRLRRQTDIPGGPKEQRNMNNAEVRHGFFEKLGVVVDLSDRHMIS